MRGRHVDPDDPAPPRAKVRSSVGDRLIKRRADALRRLRLHRLGDTDRVDHHEMAWPSIGGEHDLAGHP